MRFQNQQLARLMDTSGADLQQVAERHNLCLDDRPSSARQSVYEAQVAAAVAWKDWREHHFRYVREEVRRRFPQSAAFAPEEPPLRPEIEPNQWLIRIEQIDGLLNRYNADTSKRVDPETIQSWINELANGPGESSRCASSLADISRLMASVTPGAAALGELTELLNQVRDGRPSYVAFDAEFPGLASDNDWVGEIVERCGLAHFCTDGHVTLALFRYRVQDVLNDAEDSQLAEQKAAAPFAVPTVLDQPFYIAFHPAPGTIDWGQAVDLNPGDDCARLSAELIHARIDYQPEHWVAVSTLTRPSVDSTEIARLRDIHLDCLRNRSEQPEYGAGC